MGFTAPQLMNILKFYKEFFKPKEDQAVFCQEMIGNGADLITSTAKTEFRKAEVSSCWSNASARGEVLSHRVLRQF